MCRYPRRQSFYSTSSRICVYKYTSIMFTSLHIIFVSMILLRMLYWHINISTYCLHVDWVFVYVNFFLRTNATYLGPKVFGYWLYHKEYIFCKGHTNHLIWDRTLLALTMTPPPFPHSNVYTLLRRLLIIRERQLVWRISATMMVPHILLVLAVLIRVGAGRCFSLLD